MDSSRTPAACTKLLHACRDCVKQAPTRLPWLCEAQGRQKQALCRSTKSKLSDKDEPNDMSFPTLRLFAVSYIT